MKKIIFLIAIVSLVFVNISFADEILFGPKQYFRIAEKPNVYTDTFSSIEGNREGILKVTNGDEDGNRISSAIITVNGERILIAGDFNQMVDSLQTSITIQENNTISVELRSAVPGSYLAVEVILPFFEDFPAWRMPELAVTGLTVFPERCDPGDSVILRATVANTGKGDTPPSTLVFIVDGSEIARKPIDSLVPDETIEMSATWQAEGAGNHVVRAELEVSSIDFDGSVSNNFKIATARVSGEPSPEPELEFAQIDFDSLQLIPGESYMVPLKVRNPGFARIESTNIIFHIDGEYVFTDEIEALDPGQEMEFQIPWNDVTPGEHVIAILLYPGGDMSRFPIIKSWHTIVPESTFLHGTIGLDKWYSIGPRILDNGWAGRINTIAFDQNDLLFKKIYVGGLGSDMNTAAAPGIWKTTDAGGTWTPKGDKLSSMQIRSLAVDPNYPDIIYAGGPKGILKSIDGGETWWHFASSKIASDVNEIVLRYTGSGDLLLYASTLYCAIGAQNCGVLRYKSSDPFAISSDSSQWDNILGGSIVDLAVHPTNNSILYASRRIDSGGVKFAQLLRTKNGENITNPNDWTALLTSGIPPVSNTSLITVDIHKLYPDMIYVGISEPLSVSNPHFGIYRSYNEGNNFEPLKEYAYDDLVGSNTKCFVYNPYIRIAPIKKSSTYMTEAIYFGGQCLYQFINYEPLIPGAQVPQGGTYMVSGYYVQKRAGVDMKTLEFLPLRFGNLNGYKDDHYYSVGDQGVYECQMSLMPRHEQLQGKEYGESGDTCWDLNNDLRVTEFYDIDISKTDSDLIIGGTQDTGTVLYNGDAGLLWNLIRDGDGLYSLINPHDDTIMYSQNQSLRSTRRSEDGGDNWTGNIATGWPTGYGFGNAYMIMDPDPNYPDAVMASGNGEELFRSDSTGSLQWPYTTKGRITRFIVHPVTFDWIIGTTTGNIIYIDKNNRIAHTIFSHDHNAYVQSLSVSPADPKLLYAAFRTGGSHKDERIWAISLDTANPPNSQKANITYNFSDDLWPRVIVGDPYDKFRAYVGTDKGVWRLNLLSAGYLDKWEPYNDGFPLTTVVDLLIAPNKTLVAATKGRGAWRVITGPAAIE